MSEDCLTANVFTPRLQDIPSTGLPVMVFIHGGSFQFGLGACDLDLGQNLANTGKAVVVTFNYRLGALGWLYYGDGSIFKGNYGFEDQVLLLKWVQASILSFGGDPKKVFLFLSFFSFSKKNLQNDCFSIINNKGFEVF